MRTYTHGVIGYLLYAQRPRHEQQLAVIGGIVPDVFLALGFVAHSLEHVTHSAMAAELHALLNHSTLHTVTVAANFIAVCSSSILAETLGCTVSSSSLRAG